MSKPMQITLPITGMTCAACERNVTRALSRADGVEEAVINLATERATVQFDAEKIGVKELVASIEKSGYGVATATLELPITGMTCATCERNVDRALRRASGVLDVTVNLATERARVTYLPGVARRADLIAAVERSGYGVVDVSASDAAPEDAERQAREAEIRRQTRLVWIGAFFTIPLTILSMTRHFMHDIPGLEFLMDWFPWLMEDYWVYVFGVLATPVYFILGRQYIVGGYKSLRNGTANMDVLVALGASAAFLYSVIVVLGMLFDFTHIVGTGDYFEAAAVILTLITLGKLLEARAKGRTSEAIKKLMGLAPKTALLWRDEQEVEVPADQIVMGDLVVIKPGARVPVDAIVIEGRSAVDESMLTGESMPVDKMIGAELIGGTVNKQGRLIAEAHRVGAETALAQIIRLVEQAQGSKAPIQRVADAVSAVFVPIVLVLALVTLVGWLVIGQVPFTQAMLNAIAVLVIACPCALGLATPTAIMVGTGRGAEMGILFKNSEALERTHKLQSIALDKTGTITQGVPAVTDVIAAEGVDEREVLRLAASAERASEHPLAEAVVKFAQASSLALVQPETFESVTGKGIRAQIEGDPIVIGSPRFMGEEQVDLSGIAAAIEKIQQSARTAIVLARGGQALGAIGIADPVKASSRDAVAQMRSLGLDVVMITGDHSRTAQVIAREVGIEHVEAEVLPGDKVQVIQRLQKGGRQVGMVGDGINDAPALAQANIGIAIGTGTDIAMEASDVTLMSGDLAGVPRAIALSKATMRTIYQNLFWAFIYNIILIPVAMAGLLIPMFAAAAMAFSSFFVVSNSLRLRSSSLRLAQDFAPDTVQSSRAVSSAPVA